MGLEHLIQQKDYKKTVFRIYHIYVNDEPLPADADNVPRDFILSLKQALAPDAQNDPTVVIKAYPCPGNTLLQFTFLTFYRIISVQPISSFESSDKIEILRFNDNLLSIILFEGVNSIGQPFPNRPYLANGVLPTYAARGPMLCQRNIFQSFPTSTTWASTRKSELTKPAIPTSSGVKSSVKNVSSATNTSSSKRKNEGETKNTKKQKTEEAKQVKNTQRNRRPPEPTDRELRKRKGRK